MLPHAKKFRSAGIDPEMEERLDQLFGGVVATGDHAWTPAQGVQSLNKELNNVQEEMSNDQEEMIGEHVDDRAESSRAKRPMEPKAYGRNKKMKGSAFLRDQISQLVSVCTSSVDSKVVQPSIADSIKIVEAIPEIYNDVPLYLFAIQALEDVNKRETFMFMAHERRVLYLRHMYQQSQYVP